MKKLYQKPEAEIIGLRLREPIADQAGDGSWGSGIDEDFEEV